MQTSENTVATVRSKTDQYNDKEFAINIHVKRVFYSTEKCALCLTDIQMIYDGKLMWQAS